MCWIFLSLGLSYCFCLVVELLSFLLQVTSDIEVEPKCEVTIHDPNFNIGVHLISCNRGHV